jgi:hypothetical protein
MAAATVVETAATRDRQRSEPGDRVIGESLKGLGKERNNRDQEQYAGDS